MDRVSALKDLSAKVEAGDRPSRLIDAEVDAVLRVGNPKLRKDAPWAFHNFDTWRAKGLGGACEVVHTSGEGGVWWDSEKFTTSLDAAKALHEAVLEGLDPQYGYLVGPQYARIVHPSCGTVCDATSNNPARAWLIAIIKALIAQEDAA